jgi:hypothetical protein
MTAKKKAKEVNAFAVWSPWMNEVDPATCAWLARDARKSLEREYVKMVNDSAWAKMRKHGFRIVRVSIRVIEP